MEKICFFMATPFSKGGEQRVVSIISNLLVDQGYDVTIMCTDMTHKRDNTLYNLSKKVKIDYVRGFNNKLVTKIRDYRWKLYYKNLNTGIFKNSLLMQKFINCDFITESLLVKAFKDYDYIIGVSNIYSTMLAKISNKIDGKTIGWQHSSSERYFDIKGERLYNQEKYAKYMFKKLDAYIVLTNHDKKYLKERFNVNTIVLNNPKSIISEVTSKLKNKQFLAVGRFVPVKNFSWLIDAFNEYHNYNKDWKLVIVGEGELKDEYKKKIKEYGLEKYVKIENYTKNISDYYLNSSVYLMSSTQEGWGMVMGESIEFGLPIISTNISSASEMIKDNVNGFIIKDNNLKNYVKKMLELSNDRGLLKEFGKNSRKISNTMNNSYISQKWIDLFNNLSTYEEKAYNKQFADVKNN